MRITTKGRYGLRAVIQLAKSVTDQPISIKTIAERESLSPEFLEQIFFKLKNTGIISSTRGAGGGFSLSRAPDQVSVLEILDALGEDITLAPCHKDHQLCGRHEICPTTWLWDEGSKLMRDYFQQKTLSDVIENLT